MEKPTTVGKVRSIVVSRRGESLTITEISGPAVIRRIEATVRKAPEHYRGLVLRVYWEGQTTPSVEAPIHDFFGTVCPAGAV